jgi:hypothetical protein
MKKICSRCLNEYDIEDFPPNKARKDGRQSYCYSCKQEYDREYWNKKAKEEKKKVYDTRKPRMNKNKQLIWEYLLTHPCIDCGESDPIVLEFDHKGEIEKTHNISNMSSWSWNKILEEISKCDVRCANCHRRKTAKQFDWFKYIRM